MGISQLNPLHARKSLKLGVSEKEKYQLSRNSLWIENLFEIMPAVK